MIELITFKGLIDFVNFLLKTGERIQIAEESRRRSIGQWIVELGILVESIAMDLEHGQFPHAACAKMGYIVDRFSETVGSAVAQADHDRLLVLLEQARNIEHLYADYRQVDPSDQDNFIVDLKQIAGTLQGAGTVLITR